MIKEIDLNIYLMTFERTEYIKESLESLLKNNKIINFNLFISDNSKTNKVCNFVTNFFPQINYIKHEYSNINSQTKHFNEIIKINNSKYVMLFHDDDILLNLAVKKIYEYISKNEGVAGVSANAFKIKNNKKIYSRINRMNREIMIFKKQSDLAKRYINPFKYEVNPFSGYIFDNKLIKNIIRNDKEGGTWSDASFLIKILKKGKIVWLKEPLLFYRTHSSSASSNEKIIERVSFINFLLQNKILKRHEIKIYKVYYILRYFLINRFNLNSYKQKILFLFLLKNLKYSFIIVKWLIKRLFIRLFNL